MIVDCIEGMEPSGHQAWSYTGPRSVVVPKVFKATFGSNPPLGRELLDRLIKQSEKARSFFKQYGKEGLVRLKFKLRWPDGNTVPTMVFIEEDRVKFHGPLTREVEWKMVGLYVSVTHTPMNESVQLSDADSFYSRCLEWVRGEEDWSLSTYINPNCGRSSQEVQSFKFSYSHTNL